MQMSLAWKSTLTALSVTLVATAMHAQNPFGNLEPKHQAANNPAAVAYLFPEQVTIPAGKSTPVDLHFKVADGLHVNSHNPHAEELIPTILNFPDKSGVRLAASRYPEGKDYSFAITPAEKFSVYTGEFTIHAELIAASGEHLLEASLRYQACNSSTCMPPHTIPVVLDVIAK